VSLLESMLESILKGSLHVCIMQPICILAIVQCTHCLPDQVNVSVLLA